MTKGDRRLPMGAQTRRVTGFKPSRCSSLAKTSTAVGVFPFPRRRRPRVFFKRRFFFGRRRFGFSGAGLDRPAERLQGLPAALRATLASPSSCAIRRRSSGSSTPRRRWALLQTLAQLVEQFGFENRRRRSVASRRSRASRPRLCSGGEHCSIQRAQTSHPRDSATPCPWPAPDRLKLRARRIRTRHITLPQSLDAHMGRFGSRVSFSLA